MPTCDGDDGSRHRDKRFRGPADSTAGIDCERIDERCQVAAAADYMDVDQGMDYYYDDDDDGGSGDSMYYDSDDEKNFDEQTEEAEKKAEIDPNREKKDRYRVLTEDEIRARQDKDTAEVADVLSVPPGIAAVLLRHFKWRPDHIQEKWFSDEHRRICDALGLPPDDGGVPVPVLREEELACGICFDEFPNGEMASAACGNHLYCRACWRGYIAAAVEGGAARCLSLRCPDTSCPAPVVRELVATVAEDADRARYRNFAFRSYVEDSGGRVKWCPAPGCGNAVEFLGCSSDPPDVFCECKHGFCFRCGEEAHRPVTCETVRRWAEKNSTDSENANWVLAHTKHCPKCRKPIEKNQGCNHISCICGHHFCWLCFQPAGGTAAGGHYACGIDDKAPVVPDFPETKEEQTRRQAKASLDRYLHHYERWAANLASLDMALKDMDKLQHSGMTEMAAAVGCKETELDFLKEAYEQVADCRRVLRWSHAYGYFLDPERDVKKRELFEHLLNDANNALERLHGCAELERKELVSAPSSSGEGADVVTKKKKFDVYRERLNRLTSVTRQYFENLVKAFETDLPEIFAVNF